MKSLATPDPAFTTEYIAGFVILVWTNVLILFGLDIAPAREAALETIVNATFLFGAFVHAAWVRGKRAEAQGKAAAGGAFSE